MLPQWWFLIRLADGKARSEIPQNSVLYINKTRKDQQKMNEKAGSRKIKRGHILAGSCPVKIGFRSWHFPDAMLYRSKTCREDDLHCIKILRAAGQMPILQRKASKSHILEKVPCRKNDHSNWANKLKVKCSPFLTIQPSGYAWPSLVELWDSSFTGWSRVLRIFSPMIRMVPPLNLPVGWNRNRAPVSIERQLQQKMIINLFKSCDHVG